MYQNVDNEIFKYNLISLFFIMHFCINHYGDKHTKVVRAVFFLKLQFSEIKSKIYNLTKIRFYYSNASSNNYCMLF